MNSAAVCAEACLPDAGGGRLPAAYYSLPSYPLGLHWRRGGDRAERCAQDGVLVRVVVVLTGSSPSWLWPFTSVGQQSSHWGGTSSHWGGRALAVTR